MKSERYRRICELVEEAEACPPDERTSFLERACPDQQLRQEVTEFLAEADAAERAGFLHTPCFQNVRAVLDGSAEDGLVGLRIGAYEIRRRIAGGGMGVVYEAWQPDLKRRVALKLLRAGRLAGESERARFRTEAEAAARLQHPNIVSIHEIGECRLDGVGIPAPYLAMEYVDGDNLAARLAGVPQPPRPAAQLVESLARAIHFAHERGIVHRDLKPANILLSFSRATRPDGDVTSLCLSEAVPKITDFGLAKRLEEPGDTQSCDVLGTPSYMAPEQALGKSKDVGPGADVYALGAILYEVLTGRPPFKAATAVETLQLVTSQEPVEPSRLQPAIPRDLNVICLKCLEKSPAKRYANAAELADDLRRFVRGEPIRAQAAPISDRILKWVRRYPAVAGLIAALVLGLIGTTTGMAIAWKQRNRAMAAEVQSYLDAARLAIQRGAWSEALDRYVDAETKGQPLTPDFRLHKIRAWLATDKLNEATLELDELGRDALTPEQRALVNVYRGHLLLGADDARAEELVREALSEENLPASDAFCAQGILARTSLDALDCFDKALAHDAYNQAAREMAATVLITLGRLDDAWTHLIRSEALFPEHRGFQFLLVNVETLRGNRAEAGRRLQVLRTKLRENEAASIQALIDIYDAQQLSGAMYSMSLGKPIATFTTLLLKYKPVLSFVSQPSHAIDDEANSNPGLRIRMPVYFRKFGSDLGRHLLQTWGPFRKTDANLQDLERLVEIHPEGSLCYLHASALFLHAYHTSPTNPQELAARQRRLTTARDAYLRALETPAILPMRALVLDGLIAVELVLGSGDKANPDSAMLAQAVQHVRERLRVGPLPEAAVASICTVTALEANDLPLARLMLADWERLAPNDKSIPYRRAQLELRSGAFGPAVTAARQALVHDPKNAGARKVLETALEKRRAEQETMDRSPP